MSSKNISNEEFSKLIFGMEKITIEIPKFTDVLIVTSISKARNGGQNVYTNTYGNDEIQEKLRG